MLREATKKDIKILKQNFDTIYELPSHNYLWFNNNDKYYPLPSGDSNELIYLSEESGIITGYFYAYINHAGIVEEVITINFFDNPSLTFGKDMYKFCTILFNNPNIKTILYSCISTNAKAVHLDDRMAEIFNARLVGTLKDYATLRDQTTHDVRLYQVDKSGSICKRRKSSKQN